MTDSQIMQGIKEYISQKGFTYSDGLIENFYLSLKSRPFVLIAGNSDTDMARLPVLFAEAVGATEANGRLKRLTVPMDWMDSSDLFGWLNLEGTFVPGAIIDFLKAAQQDPDQPYFLCLDRIILSRAEYYLREVLGAVESRAQPEGEKPLVTMAYYGRDAAAIEKYGIIPALKNLYIVGTFNLDETSRPLNQRLLDRVHIIPMEKDDLVQTGSGAPTPINADNSFLQTRYYRLDQCQEHADALKKYFAVFEELNRILTEASAYVGFQVRNDAVLYLMHAASTGVLPEQAALDHEISLKVLTRVQGSAKAIKAVLCKLFRYCTGDFGAFSPEEAVGEAMLETARDPACRYPKSAMKLARMTCVCEADGFGSYWN